MNDGFERALRAFGGLSASYQGDEAVGSLGGERDCISPLADEFLRSMATLPWMHGKVLITTRLRPAPVETRDGILLQGCREEDLVQLQPADAFEFFHAQGIRGGRAEIEAACEPYGYHPLSLRLLAGLIVNDLQQPGDIVSAKRLDVSGDLVQRQHHVLEQAYTSLGAARQRLLSRIACFRSPVTYDALRALDESESADVGYLDVQRGGQRAGQRSLDSDLRDLNVRGLLHRDLSTNRFDLHPIVRRYAYDRLSDSDRTAAHFRLRDYFGAIPKPDKVYSLDDLAPVIELYHHTVRAAQFDEALALFEDRLSKATYYQLGAYQLRIELLRALFPDGEDHPPRLKDEADQAWALVALANSYGQSGQPRRSIPLIQRQIAIRRKQDVKSSVVTGLTNLAIMQLITGRMKVAETSLREGILLSQESNDDFQEAVAREILAWLLNYRGAWAEAESESAAALETFEKRGLASSQSVLWSFRVQGELARVRSATVVGEGNARIEETAIVAAAHRALVLADEAARARFPDERSYIRVYWLLGASNRLAHRFEKAEGLLNEALVRCRRINNVEIEGDILIDLARLRVANASAVEGKRLAEEALLVADRCGYVFQAADAHLVLAQLAKDRGDAKLLREHAEEALRLATCDGPPDYTYKAAYDEATALLR